MMNTQQALLAHIEEALGTKGFAKQTPANLYAPIDYTLSLGGKRIRPLLALLSARLFSESWQCATPVAVALEVFHNFTLLHDDLMDRSPLRRGQEAVHVRWGDNVAILSGDVMSIEAYRALEGVESGKLLETLKIFSQMAVDICKGQQMDMEFEERADVTLPEYIEMIRLKTSVLLGASLQLGAIQAGASAEDASLLYRVGERLGLAFQMQDDYLDVYGDEQSFGKPIGGDIMNAKKTLLLIHCQSELSSEGQAELRRLLSLPQEARTERIEGVRALYGQTQTPEYVRRQIRQLTAEAREELKTLDVPAELKMPLLDLFDSLEGRLN